MKPVKDPTDSRRRQILAGALVIGGVGLLAIFLWLGRLVPGFFGEWFGILAGIVSTPFLMEASFVVVGLMVVLGLNSWRHRREGDEFVYLEQVDGPEADELPETARWAIYRDEPLPPDTLGDLAEIEGALEVRDFTLAGELLAALDAGRLDEDPVLRLRIRLAEETGEATRAAELRKRLGAH